MITRATATGAQSFSQDLDIGELDIPAIRGLGGSVMHFIDKETGLDRVWEVEFKVADAPDLTGVGLMHIDHIAQTMSYEDMLSWTLFYTAIFDVNKSPMVDVIDPDGLVRSQVIETRDGAFRITLNGADTHRTLAGQFLADTFGASVQHIALATTDIFDTAAKLAERGFAPLPISPNYYDDLAARFDFPPGLLEKMKAAHVLYDRDEKGEFFQLYSGSFAGGLFFEILQRGSYTGFGAPNAPFRIAAQKRRLRPKGMPLR